MSWKNTELPITSTGLQVFIAAALFVFTKPQLEPGQAWTEAERFVNFVIRRLEHDESVRK